MILNYNDLVKQISSFSLFTVICCIRIRGRSSAGSPKHSETHPTKNLINKLLSMPTFSLFTITYYFKYGGVAQLGERLNGIQEVKSSILSVSTRKPTSFDLSVFQLNPSLRKQGFHFRWVFEFIRKNEKASFHSRFHKK